MAHHITQDGGVTELADKPYSLREMYAILNCSLVQAITLRDEATMWIDEEGKFDNSKSINYVATAIAKQSRAIHHSDYIVGDALILPRSSTVTSHPVTKE